MATNAEIGRKLAYLFYEAENGNLCIRDDEEDSETVRDMVFAASESDLGHDFSYEAVRDALYWIADTDSDPEDGDAAHEFADSHVDVYNDARVRWLAESPISHAIICDEAMGELGNWESTTSIIDVIGIGQYEAYRRAFAAVAEHWPDDEEEEPIDEDD